MTAPRQPVVDARDLPMPRGLREEIERPLRAALRAGAGAGTAKDALRLYGDEVYGFLLGVLDGSWAARDVYERVGQRVAREIEGFAWRCSLRAWVYSIARGELARQPGGGSGSGAGDSPGSVALPDPAITLPCRPVAVKATIAALRRRLPPEDRAILILRIDRGFGWRELAITSLGADAPRLELQREASRLRDRLQGIREDLARAAIEENLLTPGEPHG